MLISTDWSTYLLIREEKKTAERMAEKAAKAAKDAARDAAAKVDA